MEHYDVVIIGAGHAGIEAANISDKYGLKTALITKNHTDLGKLSCNPSIGVVGKTHIASEVDILGGVICKIGDKSAIHYRVVNLSKGPAVWGVRAQIDRDLYSQNMKKFIKSSKIDLIEDEAVNILEKNNKLYVDNKKLELASKLSETFNNYTLFNYSKRFKKKSIFLFVFISGSKSFFSSEICSK